MLSPFKKSEELLQGVIDFHPKLSKQIPTAVKWIWEPVVQVQILSLASYGKWFDLVAPPLDSYGTTFSLSFLIYKMGTMIIPLIWL